TTILETRQLTKKFRSGDAELTVLNEVSLQFQAGSSTAIVGPSGSGKRTLLGLCAGLDAPSSGTVLLNGTDLTTLNEDQRTSLRNEHVGFVFQSFQLIPT